MELAVERRAEERAGHAVSVSAGIAAAFGKADAIKKMLKGTGRIAESGAMASIRSGIETMMGKIAVPRRRKRE